MIKYFIPVTVTISTLALLCSAVTYANAKFNNADTAFITFASQRTNHQEQSIDLTQDANPEHLSLHNGRLSVYDRGARLWQSPDNWWIDAFTIADATYDGQLNLVLSLWKKGDYGPSQPFWETENDTSIKNHLFVYEYSNHQLQQVWGSSNLSRPNCEIAFNDIDQDGQQELLVIEGSYADSDNCHGTHVAIWQWNQWGFFNEWRSEAGSYHTIDSLLPFIQKQYLL